MKVGDLVSILCDYPPQRVGLVVRITDSEPDPLAEPGDAWPADVEVLCPDGRLEEWEENELEVISAGR
jgi:hypothetical protein